MTEVFIVGEDPVTQEISEGKSCKGREYNSALLPYIRTMWNAENARKIHTAWTEQYYAFNLFRLEDRLEDSGF